MQQNGSENTVLRARYDVLTAEINEIRAGLNGQSPRYNTGLRARVKERNQLWFRIHEPRPELWPDKPMSSTERQRLEYISALPLLPSAGVPPTGTLDLVDRQVAMAAHDRGEAVYRRHTYVGSCPAGPTHYSRWAMVAGGREHTGHYPPHSPQAGQEELVDYFLQRREATA